MAFQDANSQRTLSNNPRQNEGRDAADSGDIFWRQFSQSTSPEAFCAAWLSLQCGMIKGVSRAAVLIYDREQGSKLKPVAFWPDQEHDPKRLADLAARAVAQRSGIVLRRAAKNQSNGAAAERYDIAYPIQVANRSVGVVVLDIDPRPKDELPEVLRQLQWGSAWMEVLFHRGKLAVDSGPMERLQAVGDMIATIVAQETFHGAAFAFVTALATRFSCDRVGLGFVKNGTVRVEALSHSAEFGKNTNLMRAIAAAMEEAVDQQSTVVYPAQSDVANQINRAHAELAAQYGNGAICSVPFGAQGRIIGAVTMERPADQPFDSSAVEVSEVVSAVAGPILKVQYREDRWLIVKAIDAARTRLEHLIGPGHMTLKLVTFAVAFVILFFSLVKDVYRVSAKTVVEPVTRRAVVAAFNGYIAEAPVRAGDVVRQGQVLCKLDDRDLQLERSKWSSQEEQSLKEYYEALGHRNAPQVQVLAAQIDQARAQVALIDDQLSRTKVSAPFDGIVVSGDLSQSLGSPVERGQVLFEVAPLEAYRIILQVDERDIAEVAQGQRGHIVLAGFPNEPLPFTVEKLTPVSTSNEGRNYFRVEAQLQSTPERMRPGMEGIGKIEVDRRRLIWIWTHEVVDWARLKLWQWLP